MGSITLGGAGDPNEGSEGTQSEEEKARIEAEAKAQQGNADGENREDPDRKKDSEEGKDASTDDALLEIDGVPMTAAQVQEMYTDSQNKKAWQKTNTEKAQALADERRKLDEEYRQFHQSPSRESQQHQEAAPDSPEDLLNKHYQSRPEAFSDGSAEWELKKDQLIMQVAQTKAEENARQSFARTTADEHNTSLSKSQYNEYADKVNLQEFLGMEKWVAENVRPDQLGRYDKKHFEWAYRELHPEKAEGLPVLDAARRATEQLEAANRTRIDAGQGAHKEHTRPTEEDERNADFVQTIRVRAGKDWVPLP